MRKSVCGGAVAKIRSKCSRDISSLPGTLEEALQELERDEVIAAAFGEHTFKRYIEAKRQEWDEYRVQVSSWEINRYLRVL